MNASYRFVLLALLIAGTAPAEEYTLATGGQAAEGGIQISAQASERTRAAAADLAATLKRICGSAFAVKPGDGGSGIVIGTAREFPTLTQDPRLTDPAPTARENYLLRSTPERLVLLGNTERGVEHAVADLLHRLGVRQYFPGPHWEVMPALPDLTVDVNSFQSPSYHARTLWYGYGALPERQAGYQQWCRRNRATKGVDLLTGHAYGQIITRHAAEFQAHPEYLALVKGKRIAPGPDAKFCISNPALRALVAQDCVALLDADPALDSVSVEPSDGGGWCECAACARLGSISDRALLLSSEAARAIAARHPGKLVGQYAYNQHSPVPAVTAAPNVVVSIATHFIKGGATIDELIEGWSQHATTLGIREYLSVYAWDHDLPGKAHAAQLDYLQETIPHFHEKSARYYSAETGDNWGANGLGCYLAARLLWDVNEAGNIEALFDDFLDQCFGPAKLPMTRFYTLITRTRPPVTPAVIGTMYGHLKDASNTEIGDDIRARLDDLILYTRACELRLAYDAAKGSKRQPAFEELLRHAWRIRTRGMIHTQALWRDAPRRDKAVKLPPDHDTWKTAPDYTRDEIDALLEARGAGDK